MHNDLLNMSYLARVGLRVLAQYGHHQGTGLRNTKRITVILGIFKTSALMIAILS